MKIALRELVVAVDPLKALLDLKLPVKVSYKLNKFILNKVNKELSVYEAERTRLVVEFGEKDEEGNTTVSDPEKLKEFSAKMQELLNVEVEFDFEPIKVEDLGDIVIEPKNLVSWIFEA